MCDGCTVDEQAKMAEAWAAKYEERPKKKRKRKVSKVPSKHDSV